MSESVVTSTGLNEMRAACQQLPAAVTAALRGVADATSKRMLERARQILGSKMKSDRTELMDAMFIEEDAANRVFRVISKPPPGQPANVPIWNEYGAAGRITARYYMHDSADQEADRYHKDGEKASAEAAERLFG